MLSFWTFQLVHVLGVDCIELKTLVYWPFKQPPKAWYPYSKVINFPTNSHANAKKCKHKSDHKFHYLISFLPVRERRKPPTFFIFRPFLRNRNRNRAISMNWTAWQPFNPLTQLILSVLLAVSQSESMTYFNYTKSFLFQSKDTKDSKDINHAISLMMNSSCDDSHFDYKDTNVSRFSSSSSFACVFLSLV